MSNRPRGREGEPVLSNQPPENAATVVEEEPQGQPAQPARQPQPAMAPPGPAAIPGAEGVPGEAGSFQFSSPAELAARGVKTLEGVGPRPMATPQGILGAFDIPAAGDLSDLEVETFQYAGKNTMVWLETQGDPWQRDGVTIPGSPGISVKLENGPYVTPALEPTFRKWAAFFAARGHTGDDLRQQALNRAAQEIRMIKSFLREPHKFPVTLQGAIVQLTALETQAKREQLLATAKMVKESGGDASAILAQLPAVTGQGPRVSPTEPRVARAVNPHDAMRRQLEQQGLQGVMKSQAEQAAGVVQK